MDNNQFENKPRKLRKIKRPHPSESKSQAFGTPAKVNFLQPDGFNQLDSGDTYFDANGDSENINLVTQEEYIPQEPESIKDLLQNKTVMMLLVIAALIGAILSYMVAPSQQRQAIASGLDGIVNNPDIPQGKARCGIVEPHQGCVLYVMNPKNQEVRGKDFFTTAAKWTGRERYLIETSNMHYASTRIRPGYIAQINIPPLSY
ncbi:MAG: hypothetical protein J6039_03760 [Alphaproteobacteria bacterium]|nr:hypothetical protein [Alphaproteobacteria bacterium]